MTIFPYSYDFPYPNPTLRIFKHICFKHRWVLPVRVKIDLGVMAIKKMI